jgi:signal transduction histidine kinase
MCAVPSLLYHFGRRLSSKQSGGNFIGVERALACARFVLALISFLALYLDSHGHFSHENVVYGLALLYFAHAFSIVVLLRLRTQVPNSAVWAIHSVDLLWPSIMSLFTHGLSSPFLLFFVFALLGAAYRWGMYQVLLTTAAAIATVGTEAILLRHASLASLLGADFNIESLLMRSVYLAVFALLLGYFAESEKRRCAEASIIAQISARAHVNAGLKGTLQATLEDVVQVFGAQESLLVASEAGKVGAHMWRIQIQPDTSKPLFTARQFDTCEEANYDIVLPEFCEGAAWRSGKASTTICVQRDGCHLPRATCALPTGFTTEHSFRTLLVCTISAVPEISARIFVLDPKLGGPVKAQLRFLRELTNQVTPAVHNVYLLRGLRSRATAAGRARIARDLHDGIVQSLHAMAFRLYAVRSTKMEGDELYEELLDLQELAQKEAASIRNLLQQLKPIDVDPEHVVDFLSGMVERYRYETGISAAFVCDVPDLKLPPSICREVTRIVQEALTNVLKHSGAEDVVVRLGSESGLWTLIIEDNGRGFAFAGRLDTAALEKSRRGPLVIKDRVRAMGAELFIDSRPGQGARLEIRFPKSLQGANVR